MRTLSTFLSAASGGALVLLVVSPAPAQTTDTPLTSPVRKFSHVGTLGTFRLSPPAGTQGGMGFLPAASASSRVLHPDANKHTFKPGTALRLSPSLRGQSSSASGSYFGERSRGFYQGPRSFFRSGSLPTPLSYPTLARPSTAMPLSSMARTKPTRTRTLIVHGAPPATLRVKP